MFGAGPRLCLAGNVAFLESTWTVAMIALEIELGSSNASVEGRHGFTMISKGLRERVPDAAMRAG